MANASFGVSAGECFALLGVNGAGKTTCFKSLTKEVISSGEIKLKGFSVQTEFNQAAKHIGYCPQNDALFDLMTVSEHLQFYARLKGTNDVRKIVYDLGLEEETDTIA